jgi:hypothetical protein
MKAAKSSQEAPLLIESIIELPDVMKIVHGLSQDRGLPEDKVDKE